LTDKYPANIDEHEDVDDETTGNLHREIEEAETGDEHPQGRPGSFLNRLISHGNKKTEDEIAAGGLTANQAQYQAQYTPQAQYTQAR